MLAAFLLLCTVGARMSLADELTLAKNSVEEGDLSKANDIYTDLCEKFNDNSTVQLKFIDFLISTNQFEKIVEKFGDSRSPEVRKKLEKAQQYLGTILSGNVRNIARLADECGNNIEVLKACIQVNLMDENYSSAERLLQRAQALFPRIEAFAKMKAQLYALTSRYSEAANLLGASGEKDAAELLKKLSDKRLEIRQTTDATTRFHQTMDLLSVVSKHALGDDFSPSIFSTLQFEILFEFCQLGVKLKATGLSSRCAALIRRKRTDETMYLYMMALVNDDKIEKANIELASYSFVMPAYKNAITRHIEQAMKEREEKERRSQQRQHRQNQQHYPQHSTARKGTDFLGYYGILKVGRKASAEEIKKAYKRAVVAGKRRRKSTKKEEQAWDAEFRKINKARDVLLDADKRKLYDSGVDPDNPQPQFDYGGFGDAHPFENFFSGFQDFGFGGNRGGSRHSGRTYYYYYG
jgi:DnaJ homolog subfamily C member 3